MKKDEATSSSGNARITKIVANKKKLGKLDSMLERFVKSQALNRFSAERVGDHCLPTTISGLQIRYGLKFSREWTKVPNRFGTVTSVMSYWLEGADQLERASAIVNDARIRCGLPPLLYNKSEILV